MTAAKVLTTGTTMKCPHSFDITFKSTAALQVDGHPVVRKDDLLKTVFMCSSQQLCTKIDVFQTSTTLRDGDSPVVLAAGISTNFGLCTGGDTATDRLKAE